MIPALTLLASLAASSDAPSFEVFANYPATLVHALDAAAGRAHHGSGYRDWLLGPGASDPDWLRVYREKRPTWTSNRDDGDGPYEPYSRVSHDATSVDELVTRPGSVLSADDLVLARNAIVAADKLLAPRWAEASGKLSGSVWTEDRDGVPLALVVARDGEALRAAAQTLDASKHVSKTGWTALESLR